MATQKAITGNVQRDASMTVFAAGNYSVGNITNSLTHLTNNSGPTEAPPKPSLATGSVGSSGNVGTAKALSGGTFAYDAPANQWVMKKYTTQLSGVSKTQLLSGASDFATAPPSNPTVIESTRRLDIASWVYPSGYAVYGASKGAVSTMANGVGGNASDHAARVGRSFPGEFTAMVTGKTPTNFDYSPKTD